MVPSVDAAPSRPGSSRHGQAARETKPYPWHPHFHKIRIAMIMRQMGIACKRISSGMVQAEPDDLGGCARALRNLISALQHTEAGKGTLATASDGSYGGVLQATPAAADRYLSSRGP